MKIGLGRERHLAICCKSWKTSAGLPPKTCLLELLPARSDNPPTRDVANTHPQVRHSPSPRAYA